MPAITYLKELDPTLTDADIESIRQTLLSWNGAPTTLHGAATIKAGLTDNTNQATPVTLPVSPGGLNFTIGPSEMGEPILAFGLLLSLPHIGLHCGFGGKDANYGSPCLLFRHQSGTSTLEGQNVFRIPTLIGPDFTFSIELSTLVNVVRVSSVASVATQSPTGPTSTATAPPSAALAAYHMLHQRNSPSSMSPTTLS